jgi:mono/diheme cytochrome c family protein
MYKAIFLSFIFLGIIIFTSSFYQEYDLAKSIERGKDVYTNYCMSCHLIDGNATPDVYPPLANADYLKKPGKELINVILEGQSGEVIVNGSKYDDEMPEQSYLSDDQIADVLNYIKNSWGNKLPDTITPALVKTLRK